MQAEQAQPVQQAGAFRVEVLAQVEDEVAGGGLGLEPQRALKARQVALQRHGGCAVGDFAERVADHQPVVHQGERHVGAVAQDGAHRVQGLGEAGQRAAAHRGEAVGEADRLDDVRGGDRVVLAAEQFGDLGHPAGDRLLGGGVQVVVPAGRVDAGAVAGVLGQPAVGPRHPGEFGPELLGEFGEQRPVVRDRRHGGERGHVPGAADHRDAAVAGPAGGPDLLPHGGLADLVAPFGGVVLAQRGHRLGEGGERGEGVAVGGAVLDHVLPPGLRVRVPGGGGEFGDRVDRAGPGSAPRHFRPLPLF